MIKPLRKAVFPVGGLGTRFLPATKAIPKEMLPVAAKPLIQYAFEEAVEAGIEEFIFITGRNKSAINNHFDHAFELQSILNRDEKKKTLSVVKDWIPKSGQIAFIPQKEAKGLGHAVWCARNFIGDEPFAVLLADEMVLNKQKGLLAQMVEVYNEVGGNIIAVGEVPNEDTRKYGILDPVNPDEKGNVIKVKGMVEKPEPEDAPSNLSISGRYILEPKIFEYLAKGREAKDGEIQLTDSMQEMLSDADFYGYKFEGKRFDCGNRLGFLEANIAYAMEDESMKDRVESMLKKFA
ncbi:MAG: UTP--glucose-1-phosphate uridylyltransferase GalU [Rickettsiales bacterium]|nr:UTP--glucose-1-phosphate uridylyltransferase GalU [Pseudomonadota bacterium]MDA0967295.1 UTP--glucose-1-phosphate uridylyltransferase GalU [Pseudomonadota bacterium]MDG4544044.1 UTP--glucose-1-phosphate uridylyltransferase GalU [Rickettsiales bacterium]MDG4546262.1 UTP--glucose-1-phosphate uridylyltransferase GalU [Rickettsiales bacterium]MDG4548368.1 UTP--glucose-1-phosphate uridylyltransferase GalU [Rickettsiales bacterium]